jgi:hypothetical protein
MIHVGKRTKSKIVSKGISAGRGQQTYRGLVKVEKGAEGARTLWKSVGDRDAEDGTVPAASGADVGGAAPADAAMTQLLNRTRHLERAVEDLHQQLQQSTELIKALAEQNTQLVERVEMNRVRAQRTLVLAATALALSLGALALALLR